MADVAALQRQLDDLRDKRAMGVLKTEFNGRSVSWKSDHEMQAAINDLERRIALASGTRVRTVRLHTSKGL